MGGHRGSSSSTSSWVAASEQELETKCQICHQLFHEALECPWIYSQCPLCGGIRKVWRSKTDLNPGKLFLKCVIPNCGSFEWLHEAMARTTSPKQYVVDGCFGCGAVGHWKKDCPNNPSPSKAPSPRTAPSTAIKGKNYKNLDSSSNALRQIPTQLIIQTTLGELSDKLKLDD